MRSYFFALMMISSVCFAGEKSKIAMESGKVASDCASYNKLRASERILETSINKLVSSEYLECSLTRGVEQTSNVDNFIELLMNSVRIRQFPLSLGPQINRKTLLKDKFDYNGKFSLEYENGQHHIRITYKGKISEGRHLFWVTDEILDATYRAYYPAVVVSSHNGFVVEPYYGGGF